MVNCQDLMSLRTLPQGFPNVTVHECRLTQDYKEVLIKEFPNTLSDELNPEPMKTEKPMHITIKPGATSIKVTAARRVPLRYEEEATKTIDELIKQGVITPTNETTDWCSPAKETK